MTVIVTQGGLLSEAILPREGTAKLIKQVVLVLAGVTAMWIAAKIKVPMWPVPATLQTFVLLTIGASYGARLGVLTMLAYVAIGALGFDVFANSSADSNGLSYMLGATGGYLVGFIVACAVMGSLARAGWDRRFATALPMMLIGLAVVYAFGLSWMAWLFIGQYGLSWVVTYGFLNFVPFEIGKIALAAIMFPAVWKMVGNARS